MPTNSKEYNQQWYAQNKEKVRRYNLTNRPSRRLRERSHGQNLKDICFKAYGGYSCVCCDEYNPTLLTLDHKEGGGEQHRKELKLGAYDLYRWIIRNNFPPIFQVLCWNCNCGRAKNRGICPHHTLTETDKLLICQLAGFRERLHV